MDIDHKHGSWRYQYRQDLRKLTIAQLSEERRTITRKIWKVQFESILFFATFYLNVPLYLYEATIKYKVVSKPATEAMGFLYLAAMLAVSQVIYLLTLARRRRRWREKVKEPHATRLVKLNFLMEEYKRRGIRP